jgi:hypothetical protein
LALVDEIPKFLGTPEIAGKSKDLKFVLQRLGQKKKKKIRLGCTGEKRIRKKPVWPTLLVFKGPKF